MMRGKWDEDMGDDENEIKRRWYAYDCVLNPFLLNDVSTWMKLKTSNPGSNVSGLCLLILF